MTDEIPPEILIHENMSFIMLYAYSKPSLDKLMEENYNGEWKYLQKCCFTLPKQKTARALRELAVHLRVLD